MSGTKHYLYNLQALRFLAAAIVLFGHAQHEVLDLRLPGVKDFRPLLFIDWGFGVDIFFVISGFVMYYLMHDKFGSVGAATSFMRRRVARVVPMYWFFTTLMLMASFLFSTQVAHSANSFTEIISSYFFIPTLRKDGGIFPVLALGWTLNYEVFFYVAFALALLAPRRIGMFVLLFGFLILVGVAAVSPPSLYILKFWGDPIVLEFLAGIYLASVFIGGYRLNSCQAWMLVTFGFVVAIGMTLVHAQQYVPRAVACGVPAVMVTTGIVLLRVGDLENLRFGTLFVLGGDASYVLYLSHPFSINIVALIWQKLALPYLWLFVITSVVVSIVGSLVVHFIIERPVLKLLTVRH